MSFEDALPLSGAVLCCTSLTQDVRTRIADVAQQLGAVHKLDLTSDVTHLLVGGIQTPKYRFVARERPEVKVLRPEYLDRVNELWRDDEDLGAEKLRALEEEYRVPTFASLHICITGFEDLELRKSIQRDVEARGGKFNPDLVAHVTHLVAARPEGAKYTRAKQWGIRVVGLKWLEDCMIRGMVVDEGYYPPELPREKQGVGAFTMLPRRPERAPGKRGPAEAAPADRRSRKKLRKSASMRLGGHSQDMWQDLSQHEVQVETSMVDSWQDDRTDESQTMRDSPAGPRRSDATEIVSAPEIVEPQGLFAGDYVLIHGFDAHKAKQLRAAVERDGAVVVRNAIELEAASENMYFKSRCLLTPHAQPAQLPVVPPATLLVTEWWVERCYFYRQKLDPADDVLSQPLAGVLIPAFRDLKITTTGFDQVNYRMAAEAVKLMGAEYQEQLLPSTSVLVCASSDIKREKALYASKHNIPVVSTAWLWESLKQHSRLPLDSYQFRLPRYDGSSFTPDASHDNVSPSAIAPSRGSRGREKKLDDTVQPKRLSNTRRRHATPSLVLKNGSVMTGQSGPAPQKPRPGPFVHEDDDGDENDTPAMAPEVDRAPQRLNPSHAATAKDAVSQPLREISSNAPQARNDKSSDQSDSLGKPRHDDPVTEESLTGQATAISPQHDSHEPETVPPKSPRQDTREGSAVKENTEPAPKMLSELTSDLAGILNRRVASGRDAASHARASEKRKHRPLGRNLSGASLISMAGKHSASHAMPAHDDEGEAQYSEADGFAPCQQQVGPPPGTQLEYGDDGQSSDRRVLSVRDSEGVARKKEAMGAAAVAGGRRGVRARSKKCDSRDCVLETNGFVARKED